MHFDQLQQEDATYQQNLGCFINKNKIAIAIDRKGPAGLGYGKQVGYVRAPQG